MPDYMLYGTKTTDIVNIPERVQKLTERKTVYNNNTDSKVLFLIDYFNGLDRTEISELMGNIRSKTVGESVSRLLRANAIVEKHPPKPIPRIRTETEERHTNRPSKVVKIFETKKRGTFKKLYVNGNILLSVLRTHFTTSVLPNKFKGIEQERFLERVQLEKFGVKDNPTLVSFTSELNKNFKGKEFEEKLGSAFEKYHSEFMGRKRKAENRVASLNELLESNFTYATYIDNFFKVLIGDKFNKPEFKHFKEEFDFVEYITMLSFMGFLTNDVEINFEKAHLLRRLTDAYPDVRKRISELFGKKSVVS